MLSENSNGIVYKNMLNIINKGLAVMTSNTITKSEYKLPQASNIKHCIKYEVLH